MKKIEAIYLTSLPPLFSDLANMVTGLSGFLTFEQVNERIQEFINSCDLRAVTDVVYHLRYNSEYNDWEITYFRN